MLYSMQEIQAVTALLNRMPMTAAEQLYAQGFFQRLVDFCTPPEPEPDPVDDAQAMADAMTIAEALDEAESIDSDDREFDRHG